MGGIPAGARAVRGVLHRRRAPQELAAQLVCAVEGGAAPVKLALITTLRFENLDQLVRDE